jgi:hypothetical protein
LKKPKEEKKVSKSVSAPKKAVVAKTTKTKSSKPSSKKGAPKSKVTKVKSKKKAPMKGTAADLKKDEVAAEDQDQDQYD